jgi:predicted GTPase
MMSSNLPEHMAAEVSRIAEKAASEADIVVFLGDYREGPTQDDRTIAVKLRDSKKVSGFVVSSVALSFTILVCFF